MRKSNTEPLAEVLKQYIRAIGGEKKIKEIRLVKEWANIIGPNISKNTEKIFINNNKVYIRFNSPIIKQEIMLLKTEIIKRFNTVAGEKFIYDIVFL